MWCGKLLTTLVIDGRTVMSAVRVFFFSISISRSEVDSCAFCDTDSIFHTAIDFLSVIYA